MRNFPLVGGGGFVGAVARHYLTMLVPAVGSSRFPLGTLVVNASGCLAIGLLAGWGERTGLLSDSARLFLVTGLLGGYTTFSSFALETHLLGRDQALLGAMVNIALQMALGLFAVALGYRMTGPGAA